MNTNKHESEEGIKLAVFSFVSIRACRAAGFAKAGLFAVRRRFACADAMRGIN
jgi:hypothetical protein